jgi:hypothetical protein
MKSFVHSRYGAAASLSASSPLTNPVNRGTVQYCVSISDLPAFHRNFHPHRVGKFHLMSFGFQPECEFIKS